MELIEGLAQYHPETYEPVPAFVGRREVQGGGWAGGRFARDNHVIAGSTLAISGGAIRVFGL